MTRNDDSFTKTDNSLNMTHHKLTENSKLNPMVKTDLSSHAINENGIKLTWYTIFRFLDIKFKEGRLTLESNNKQAVNRRQQRKRNKPASS